MLAKDLKKKNASISKDHKLTRVSEYFLMCTKTEMYKHQFVGELCAATSLFLYKLRIESGWLVPHASSLYALITLITI